eukprot:CAMPEP_0181211786 /NCGR_PEP_ID=MMETSP1096-20121128/23986_1 /TAXON_ID=156174 ORGANISM="Chrysochromulina ericina, Strain CCMP281" /NCGR_SAMPLE_ID=MMETSP1096 /ASSEMBLY_ACC=CAM_ASM_000453 /LENGTH=117 /DNA_ID=CAMNT_0023303239 /DNA_START=120 /DNA_END=473 /DNA_ORIENTATION=-
MRGQRCWPASDQTGTSHARTLPMSHARSFHVPSSHISTQSPGSPLGSVTAQCASSSRSLDPSCQKKPSHRLTRPIQRLSDPALRMMLARNWFCAAVRGSAIWAPMAMALHCWLATSQ